MAARKSVRKTNTVSKRTNNNPALRTSLFTFIAAFMGVAVGFAASLAVVLPMVRSEFSDQSKQLSHQLVSMMPASTTLADACSQPTGSAPEGQVLGAASVAPTTSTPAPTSGGSVTNNTFITKLVGGQFAKTTATISDTGPNSTNQIETTNTNTTTVANTNSVSVANNNSQSSSSGDANVTNNTSGGNATTGSATNTNNVSTSVQINN